MSERDGEAKEEGPFNFSSIRGVASVKVGRNSALSLSCIKLVKAAGCLPRFFFYMYTSPTLLAFSFALLLLILLFYYSSSLVCFRPLLPA